MGRTRYIWLGFAVCLAVLMAAMGWISVVVLRLDRAEARARQQATLEEDVQLALWRLDTALAPLIAQESARPYFEYHPLVPVDRQYAGMFHRMYPAGRLAPSPLLEESVANVILHFQFEPDGRLTSPEVPTGDNRKLAVPEYVSDQTVAAATERLNELAEIVQRDTLLAQLPQPTPSTAAVVLAPPMQSPTERMAQRRRRVELNQLGQEAVEFDVRNQAIQQQTTAMLQNINVAQSPLTASAPEVSATLMTPLWVDGQLLLVRRVLVAGEEYVQGCQLNWPVIKASLLETIEDLLPRADIEPVTESRDQPSGQRLLAAIPARLVPGELPGGKAPRFSPLTMSLWIAWVCVVLAAAAVAGLLAGVIRLGQRRATFVSAVTHELRTPLTTFQMYAEMLAEDMVPAGQRQQYLNTLRTEAARLTHLVENVLAYARLERGRNHGRLERVGLGKLVDDVARRLSEHAAKADMEVVVDITPTARLATVRTNSAAVEQILFNLVDNSCKYAAGRDRREIHLSVHTSKECAELSVQDHGTGISAAVRRTLFNDFSKSSEEAAQTAPGVGLGLALSRRLARDLGGDLCYDDRPTDGTRFVLTLPGVIEA